jgi:hypothetical protein
MTFNGSWGYMPSAIDWHSVRAVIGMLAHGQRRAGQPAPEHRPRTRWFHPTRSARAPAGGRPGLKENGEAV